MAVKRRVRAVVAGRLELSRVQRGIAAVGDHALSPGGAANGAFADRVIAWQRIHGRHDLPWQNTRDPYRIWLSEIMLQQTQVTAVIGYYQRFLDRFPDLQALATSAADEVMRLWSGLGYYSRARNLHRAAGIIVNECKGKFPATQADLMRLPGIGRSTAAAVAAFAFGQRAAILDGNVKRVFARYFGIEGYPGLPAVEAVLWERAEALLPKRGLEPYTQGLMDLGATLCTRTRPRCPACPLAADCVAQVHGRTAELPHKRPRKPLPRRSCVMLVMQYRGQVLLERRPPAGIWGGLLCLPQADDLAAARNLAETLGADWHGHTALGAIEHGFTHYHLTIRPVSLSQPASSAKNVAREPRYSWMPLLQALDAGLPSPVRKLLLALEKTLNKSLECRLSNGRPL